MLPPGETDNRPICPTQDSDLIPSSFLKGPWAQQSPRPMRATIDSVLACCWPADAAGLPKGMCLRASFPATSSSACGIARNSNKSILKLPSRKSKRRKAAGVRRSRHTSLPTPPIFAPGKSDYKRAKRVRAEKNAPGPRENRGHGRWCLLFPHRPAWEATFTGRRAFLCELDGPVGFVCHDGMVMIACFSKGA